MDEICPINGTPHEGIPAKIRVTILDGKRTVVGICMYCHETIMAQEPLYRTVLAPIRRHHLHLPRGMWECPVTGIDHMAAQYVKDGERRFTCVDCDNDLTRYQFRDNLTGLEADIFLHSYMIEEEPI